MTPVTLTRTDDGVAVVRLSSPGTRNAVDMALATALTDAIEDSADAGAIALLAEGEHFCVGGNVRQMAAANDPGGFVRALAHEFHRTVCALSVAPPVVVGVRGWAAGAGFSLVLAGDVVIAAQGVTFQPAYPGIGVTPDGGMSWTLPRVVGERRARSILMQNRALLVSEALQLGIVDRVVADDALEAEVLAVAATLATGPRGAIAGAKSLVAASASRPLSEHLEAEAESIGRCADSADGREGVAAFAARRAPRFGT